MGIIEERKLQASNELIKAQNAKKVLIHYGSGSVVRSGLLDRVKKSMDDAGISYVELGGVVPNPRPSLVYEGIELAKAEGVDFILAVGGGSVIDSAKAIAAGTLYDGDFWDFYSGKPTEKALPVGTVLTIAAAGSEGSSGSVITKEEGMLKRSAGGDALRPKFSILNPEYTYSVPQYQMISGIFDIFSHLMEQYFSGEDDCTSDYLLEGLMLSLISASRKALINPEDYEARSNIMWCATMGLNKILGLSKTQDWEVHMIEHQVGAYTDCAHGIGLAIISPAYYRYIYRDGLHKFVRYAKQVWGVEDHGQGDDAIALEGIDRLEAFIKELGIPTTLREVGTTEEMLPLIADSTILGGGYKQLTAEDVLAILKACY